MAKKPGKESGKDMAQDPLHKIEERDGMIVEWDVPIAMPDGVVLRADVFRPMQAGKHPVIISHGPYAKGLAFQDTFKSMWDRMVAAHPDVPAGSTNKYQNWEVVDPEKWVPDGYVCIRVDSRGAGRSPGYMNVWSAEETDDFARCIDWAGVQPWSNGKVAVSGISYYAINAWQVATRQPKHLSAIVVWEGGADFYRDIYRHGGIVNEMPINWYPRQVGSVQHGVGDRGKKSWVTGEPVAGPVTLSEEELKRNRADLEAGVLAHPLEDEFYTSRSPDWSKVVCPLLSANNWGGQGLHPRGNCEGYMRAASKQKWFEAHGLAHWPHYYTDYGRELQKRFLDYFLKGEKNGWDKQPPVQLNIRHPGETFVIRHEDAWPIPRTQWTKFYLSPDGRSLGSAPFKGTSVLNYHTQGDGITFWSEPMKQDTEITGPLAAKLWVSSLTSDADLFLIFRVFDPSGQEVVFQGALDPHTPIAQGWLRASQRRLDPELSKPWRPYHSHKVREPLVPKQDVEVDVELWPTCIVVPKGYRMALTVQGKDYHYDAPPTYIKDAFYPFSGVASFFHNHPKDRPEAIYKTWNSLHFAPDKQPYVLLPVIPGK